MQLHSACLLAAQLSLCSALAGVEQQPLSPPAAKIAPLGDGEHAVPGKNGRLAFCDDPKDHILNVTDVTLEPETPAAGQNVTISASFVPTQDIEEGSTIVLQVKLQAGRVHVPILTQRLDLCEQLTVINETCPLHRNQEYNIKQKLELPAQIPKANYLLNALAQTKEEKTITCLTTEIAF